MGCVVRHRFFGFGGLRGVLAGAGAVALLAPCLGAQSLIGAPHPGGRVLMMSGDATILDTSDARRDIPCTVTPQKPQLGFDLKFHAGYEVSIPMKELNGGDDVLTTIFRVTPQADPDNPVYFTQKISVPKLEDDAGGNAVVEGGFVLGEGNFQVDWMMRDHAERVCSFYWPVTSELSARDRNVKAAIAANKVEPSDGEPFREEPPISREINNGLNVKVLVNFAPQQSLAASMQPFDTSALISILRNISREPKIGKFSLVAFNMQEQRVVYRQDLADRIDFPALGESLNSLKLGTVRYRQLEQKHADTEFLTQLITKEMANDHPDAVIFAGPKVMMEAGVSADSIKALSTDVSYPVFYMNYILNPNSNPWRDAIGNVVKRLRGFEYTISQPHDLWNAWTEIMSHIVKLRIARASAGPSSTP